MVVVVCRLEERSLGGAFYTHDAGHYVNKNEDQEQQSHATVKNFPIRNPYDAIITWSTEMSVIPWFGWLCNWTLIFNAHFLLASSDDRALQRRRQ